MKFFAAITTFATLAASVLGQQLSFVSPASGSTFAAGNNYAITLSEADNLSSFQQISAVFALSNVTFDKLETLIPPVLDISAQNFFENDISSPADGFTHTFFVTIPFATAPGLYNISVANWYTIGLSGELSSSVASLPVFIVS